ncbi:MAG: uncharacterized protein JWR62_2977 [Modestobacter sp.]|nr:uncharacterized protein [Modestobacter sp.]
MTRPGGRGRRDNGLDATLWSPLRDVDPRVGEHLLDLLAIQGIAAYLEPATDVGPYTRTVFLPSPPSDRLYVDRTRRGDARALLSQHAEALVEPAASPPTPPTGDHVDTDAEFARIVAAFEAEHGPTAPSAEEPRNDPPPPPAELSVLDALDAQDHYEPPPPPPLPVLAPATVYALLLVALGVLLVVRPSTLRLSVDVGLALGAAAIVGGVVMLVSRMRDSADDGDDGAVV